MPESGADPPTSPAHLITRALTSISVASAHVQLVRRWLERGNTDRATAMLDSLRTSEQALRESAAIVRELDTRRCHQAPPGCTDERTTPGST